MKITVAKGTILSQKADAAVVGIKGKGAARNPDLVALGKAAGDGGALAALATAGLPESKPSLTVRLGKGPFKHVHLVRVGKDAKAPAAHVLQGWLTKAQAELDGFGCRSLAVDLPSLSGAGDEGGWAVRQAAQALGAGSYTFSLGQRMAQRSLRQAELVTAATGGKVARSLRIGKAIGEGMRLAKHLAEQPPNLLYPATLAQAARAAGKDAGFKVTVLDEKALVKLRMGGMLAVGQGSARKPCLIVMQHKGGAKGEAPVALIGKGVTFDTGGNSIKPGSAMLDMKFDMCGAAGVIGTMVACARMRLPRNVVALAPCVENMVAGDSFRPDDIIRMMDGQRVEVLNTDAEGRLILADALTYAQRFFKPKLMLDAATLTGACLVALGEHRCGMFATGDELAAAVGAAGDDSGDPCWRLPLDDEYDRLIDSKIVDIQNIGGGRNAGTVTAACFLKRFVKSGDWVHLDIAGTAWQNRRASGRPVPLLSTFLAKRARLL